MKDDYRIGSELDWLKHSNEELARLARKREIQVSRWRSFAWLLLMLLGWVVYRFSQVKPLSELF